MTTFNTILKEAFIKADIEDFNNVTDYADWSPSRSFEKKMNKLIRKRKSFFWKYVNTPRKKAVIAILVSTIFITSALSIQAIRKPIWEFIIKVHEKGTDIYFKKDASDKLDYTFETEPPGFIETYYLPNYIPEGFNLTEFKKYKFSSVVTYRNKHDTSIEFAQYTMSTGISLNTEGTTLTPITIGNHSGYYYRSNYRLALVWNTDEYTFMILAPRSFDISEIEKMAVSLAAEQQ